ncbi:MAG: PBSX family phage terminase large subunit [Mucispirillum sp.]|nr:PBSX family phage terminase large subunit [Mucispirillum sp.]
MKPKQHIDITVPAKFKGLWKPYRYKVLYGGRGSGKTHAIAEYLVVQSLLNKERILCTREIQKSIKESVYEVLVQKISKLGLEKYFNITESRIANVSGSEFIFAGLRTNVESIKSMEGITKCWIEEAQTISRNSLDVLIPTIRKEKSELIFSFNPCNEMDPVYQDFVVNPKSDAWVQKVNYVDNPLFPEVLEKERAECEKRNPDDYKWIWLGELRKISDAQIFKNIFEVKEFETPSSARFYHGADWGYAEDPTTLIRCFIEDGCLYIDKECYGKHVELDDLPRFFSKIETAARWPVYGDAARPDIIKYLRRRGYNIRKCDKWQGSVEQGISYIRNFYKVYIHPDCINTINEFERYSWKQDRNTNEILPVPVDKDNHCIDALRYALTKKIKKNIF